MPSAPNSPHQNWCVDHMFRTRGTPTLSSARDGRGSAEGVLANHLGNVRVVTLDLLELPFHDAHLVHVFHEPLGAGVAADHALPALGDGHLRPWTTLGPGKLHVDERARAVDGAPLADGLGTRGARVGQGGDRVEPAEARGAAALAPVRGTQGGTDRTGFARIRMHDDFAVRHLAPDEVHLRFHDRHVAMRSALKDELAPGRTKILKLP